MKKIIFICLFFIISGCAVFQPEEPNLIQPKLLKQSDLPRIRETTNDSYLEFYCEMQINIYGDVERATILNGTGDAIWDSLAAVSLLKWKYTPAIYDGHPVKLVIERKVKVVFSEPLIISLAEIQVQNIEKADSIYNALMQGSDFNSLCLNCSISKSREKNGILGEVNIKHFSNDIRFALNRLDEGDFTKPIPFGDRFVIYKRLQLNN